MGSVLRALGCATPPGCAGRRRVASGLCLLLLAAASAAARPPSPAGQSAPSGGGDSRREAIRTIPWDALAEPDRAAVSEVVSDATLFHRMPTRSVECDAELFALLTERPEMLVEVWNLMGISKLTLDPIGPQRYRAVDATGTVGDLRTWHAGGGDRPRRVVALCQGVYDAPAMPKPLSADCVLLLTWQAMASPDGRPYVRADLDAFIDLDRPAAQLIARTLKPLLVRTANHNFTETMRFVAMFSRTAERNPAGMNRLAGHLRKIDEPTRRRFVTVCHRTADRAATRLEAQRRVTLTSASAGRVGD